MITLAGWSPWSWMVLRAPGFPAAQVLVLAAPRAAAATDALASTVHAVEAARAHALAALAHAPASKALTRALKALRRGELPAAPGGFGAAADAALAALARADADRQGAQRAAEQALDEDGRVVARALRALAVEPRLHEALLWQNRAAVHGSIASLLRRADDATDAKTREQRRLLASLVQRYAVKNDTIGFFGPVGWARLTDADVAIDVRPGPALLAARHVYFEHWAVDALAQRLAEDAGLRLYLRPRRAPGIGLEGATLHHPNGTRVALPAPFARALALIDGERTARDIAAQLAADPTLGADAGIEGEGDGLMVLEELERRKLCTWTLEIPTATFHPERELRAQLERAEGPPRDRALAQLDALEARRADVAAAAGEPERLDAALGALEATFEELTGTSATRKGGETYAGRTLVFEDCRRDLEVELGRPFVARLMPALGLVLDSARWYTHAIATRYARALGRELRDLRAASTDGRVPYLRLHARLPALFPGPAADHGIAHDVAQELQARWERLLALGDDGARVVHRTSAALRAAAAEAFAAPAPGWPSARHHSPDILVAARDAEAVRQGDYQIVLGEIHVGFNTVTLPCLLKEHPAPHDLVRAREADLPAPGIAPVWSRARNRADFFSVSRHDLDLEHGDTRSGRPRSQVLATGDLVVEELAGGWVVHPRTGGPQVPLIAFLEQHLIAESFSRFRLFSRRPHMPRVVIDDVIVQREAWQLPADAIGFAAEETELGRFLAARRFATHHGMPRHVYAKADAEPKPHFVDFDSPLLVEILARQIKRSQRVTFSEMSPDLGQCWLADVDGARYTSELRLAVTDPRTWTPIVDDGV